MKRSFILELRCPVSWCERLSHPITSERQEGAVRMAVHNHLPKKRSATAVASRDFTISRMVSLREPPAGDIVERIPRRRTASALLVTLPLSTHGGMRYPT